MTDRPTVNRRVFRRWLTYAQGAVFTALLAGQFLGWWGALPVFVGTTVSFGVETIGLLRLNDALLRDGERQLAMIEAMMTVHANTRATVLCASCHVRALVSSDRIGAGPPDMIGLPRGWETRHDRPYCPGCLAK